MKQINNNKKNGNDRSLRQRRPWFRIVSLLIFCCNVSPTWATAPLSPQTFSEAKKIATQIYQIHRVTFYCQCAYSSQGQINWSSCGYRPRHNVKRASRMEWEHIVPAWEFGHTHSCWNQPLCHSQSGKWYKGRRCCDQIDPTFRAIEADLHNLVPSVGEVNGDWNNFPYKDWKGTPSQYGQCPFITDFKDHRVQPPPYTRGFIARTYFYMHQHYDLPISTQQETLFHAWDRLYPPTSWEIERNQRIAQAEQ